MNWSPSPCSRHLHPEITKPPASWRFSCSWANSSKPAPPKGRALQLNHSSNSRPPKPAASKPINPKRKLPPANSPVAMSFASVPATMWRRTASSSAARVLLIRPPSPANRCRRTKSRATKSLPAHKISPAFWKSKSVVPVKTRHWAACAG